MGLLDLDINFNIAYDIHSPKGRWLSTVQIERCVGGGNIHAMIRVTLVSNNDDDYNDDGLYAGEKVVVPRGVAI